MRAGVITAGMKKRLIALGCAVLIGFPMVSSANVGDADDVAMDAIFVRPVSFIATILGSAFFVATLPFTAPACGVHAAAHALVGVPGHATFVRELGDLNGLEDQ